MPALAWARTSWNHTSRRCIKQALTNYKKAIEAAGFCNDIGNDAENYFAALARTFEQALTAANTLPARSRDALIARLDRVRRISRQFGYGVGDAMDFVFVKYTKRKD